MLGEHAAFILSSYAISFAALIGITAVVIMTYHNRKRELEKIERSESGKEE